MEVVQSLKGHRDAVNALTLVPDSNQSLWSASDDCCARFWDLRTSTRSQKCLRLKDAVTDIAIHPSGDGEYHVFLASGNSVFSIDSRMCGNVVTVVSNTNSREVLQCSDEVNAVALLPELRVAAASDDSRIYISEFHSRDFVTKTLDGHTNIVSNICVVGDDLLASAGLDGCLHVWDIETLQLDHSFNTGATDAMFHDLDASANGGWVAAALANSVIHLYDLEV